MEGEILKNWRILAAMFFSAVLVVGAYLLARGFESPSIAQASTETELLKAIAAKDSDADGLPDWEESLYGGDPQNADTFHLGMTDGEAVAKGLVVPKAVADIAIATSSSDESRIVDPSLPPAPAEGTLTSAFSKSFFTLYVSAKQAKGGVELTSEEIATLAGEAIGQLSKNLAPAADFKSANSISISGSGPEALKVFAADAEAVLKKNVSDATMSEILYLQVALQENDTAALGHLASIAKAYRDSAVGLTALSVPQELAAADLALVNALMRMSEISSDFARVNTDPLIAMLSLQQYLPAAEALGKAFIDIGKVYSAAGVVLPSDAPGASLLSVIAGMAEQQRVKSISL